MFDTQQDGVFISDRYVEHWYQGACKLRIPLTEAKSGIYTDRRGRKYKLVNGKRVPLKSDHIVVPNKLEKRLKSFLKGRAKKVQSSYLKAVKYDKENQILRVEFHSKPGVWFKYKVDPERAASLFSAESKGKFFHSSGIHKMPYETEDKEKETTDAQG